MAFEFKADDCLKAIKGVIVVGLAIIACAAHAGNTLVGGGAALPAFGYTGQTSPRQLLPLAGSLFGEYSAQPGNPQTSYCQTGSGTGENIFARNFGTSVQNVCANVPTPPTGFGAVVAGRTDLAQPSFAATDTPLTSLDYANYVNGHATGFPVAFPVVAGSIAIVFNKAGLDTLNLSAQQVCQIFSGQITQWQQISADATGPISVVFRSDSSGTTFGFANYLAATCGGTANQHFIASSGFRGAVSEYLSTLPSSWVGFTLDTYIGDYVANNDGTIAYMAAPNALVSFLPYATVNGLDPFADFGNTPWTVNSSDIRYNQVISGVDSNTGRPVTSPALGAPSTQCIALVNPASYASPSAGYPIVTLSYLLANSANNGSDLAATRGLMWAAFNPTITANVVYIGPGTGLSFLNTNFTQSQISGCLN
jgi:phosphate transport system substrate-binding protein